MHDIMASLLPCRDIKPGNIICHITDTGRSVYKIADFGTARQLAPEAEFMSLCGTEEYLNPAVYKHAVLQVIEELVWNKPTIIYWINYDILMCIVCSVYSVCIVCMC